MSEQMQFFIAGITSGIVLGIVIGIVAEDALNLYSGRNKGTNNEQIKE